MVVVYCKSYRLLISSSAFRSNKQMGMDLQGIYKIKSHVEGRDGSYYTTNWCENA